MTDINIDTLPEPDAEAKEISALLMHRIQSACDAANGWIRFSEYMNIALYEPALGYYSGGLQKFGSKGDFITSPEVSPLFGQCLANQLCEIIQNYKKISNDDIAIVEFGAGNGALAAVILLRLEELDSLPDNYLILEISAELKERQAENIKNEAPHLLKYVQWLNKLPENLTNAIVIANEVLDAMPVECFKVSDTIADGGNKIESLMIGMVEGSLKTRYIPSDDNVAEYVDTIQKRSAVEFSDSYCTEYNPSIKSWLSALESTAENMVVLLIDYGYNEMEYYHSDRVQGTLMCYYRHRAHDNVFWWPGLQDITAFVNFTDIAYSAVDLGLHVSGYTTQAAFLLANGLSDLHASLVTEDAQQQIVLSQQIKTLTLPSEMGDRFKVIALTKNYDESLSGFSLQDLRSRL